MIEKAILDFLNERVNVPVIPEIPSPAPLEYLLVIKTGGTCRDFLHTTQIVTVSTGRTLKRAADIHERVKGYMDQLITLDVITKVKLIEEGNTTDTLAKRHRYQAIYEITHY